MKGVVLIVGESFYPDNTPRANRWHYFASRLSAANWAVRVISRYQHAEKFGVGQIIEAQVRKRSLASRAAGKLFSLFIFEKEIFWAARRLISVLRNRAVLSDVTLVVGYGLPFSGIVLAVIAAKVLKKPCMIEYGDPVDINPARRSTLLERLANRWCIQSAETVIVTDENYATYMRNRYDRAIERLPPIASVLERSSEDQYAVAANALAKCSTGIRFFYAGRLYRGLRPGDAFFSALERTQLDAVLIHAGLPYESARANPRYKNIGYIERYTVLYLLYWAGVTLYFANEAAYQTPSKVVEVAYVAPVVLAIGVSRNSFEGEMLANATEVVHVQNAVGDIVKALQWTVQKGNQVERSRADFDRRLIKMRAYDAEIVASLETLIDRTRN